MRIDNFYFVVENIEKSIEFYSKLLEKIRLLSEKIDGRIGKMKIIKYTSE